MQGSIVFIDVPTRLPDFSPSDGVSLLSLFDLIRNFVERLKDTQIISSFLTNSRPPLNGSVTPRWISRALRGRSWLTVRKQVELSHSYRTYKRLLLSIQGAISLVVRYHIAAPEDKIASCGYCSRSQHTTSKCSRFLARRMVPSAESCIDERCSSCHPNSPTSYRSRCTQV